MSDLLSWQSLASEFRKAQPSSPIWYGLVDQAVGALLAARIEQLAPPVRVREDLSGLKSNPFVRGSDLSEAYEKGWKDALYAACIVEPARNEVNEAYAIGQHIQGVTE